MYSKNDYRYYLEHQLMMSDDYLAHYGVMGMKWGVRNDNRIAKLSSRHSKNDIKIAKYQSKLNTTSAQKRAAKAAKFKAKQARYDRKAAKARARLAKGKNISTKQMKRIVKAEQYAAKTAKYSYKNDKLQAKINKLNYKNTKIDKKLVKLKNPSRAGARAYQKGLNKLDKQRAKYDVKTFSSNKEKGLKAEQKLRDISREMRDTVSDATLRGYNVSSTNTKRHTGSYVIPTMQSGYMDGKKYTVKKPKKQR